MTWRVLGAFAVLATSCALAACGEDAGSSAPARLAIETSDPGPNEVSMRAPATVPAGPVVVELRNRGDTLHDAQLFRVDGDRTAADVVDVLENADNESKPGWLHPNGGVAPVQPGETAAVRQVLAPGVYYAADTQERPEPGIGNLINAAKDGIARIEVTGDGGGELPATPATIVAREYGFDVDGIVAGANRVTFRNAGRQFHQAAAFRIPDGPSYRAGRQAVLRREGRTGWVPVDAPHERATTVLEGGGEQVAELTFEPGRYLLLCFVADREGGGPHWTYGMTSRIDVPPARSGLD